MANAVEARGLSKIYRLYRRPGGALLAALGRRPGPGQVEEIRALDDVDFTVPRGRSLGVIGRNGSGKSTLLRILAGITAPSSGALSIDGRLSSFLSLGVGYDGELSGYRNIYLSARLAGFSKREVDSHTDAIVSFADLGEAIHRPLKTYSSGMMMRLAFSVASHLEPQVLLVDEVLAVGDRGFQVRCLERIKQFKEGGGSLIFVSHHLGTLRAVCEETIWLHHGRLEAAGESWSVIRKYEDYLRSVEGSLEVGPVETGSGELTIHHVDFLGADGRPRGSFAPDDSLRMRLSYRTVRPIDRPNIGVAIYRNDGLLCYGTSSAKQGVVIETLDGEGSVDFVLEPVALLAGRYHVTVAAFDEQDVHKYHYVEQKYGFTVHQGQQDEGVVRLRGRFEVG